MPVYRCLWNFVGNGEGWTESHFLKTTQQTPKACLSSCQAVARNRVQFLGTPFFINAIRISAYANDDGTKARRASFLQKQVFMQTGSAAQFPAEPSVVALQVRGFPDITVAPVQFWGNENSTLCGGPQDDAVNNAGVVSPAATNLGAAFVSWVAALKSTDVGGAFGWAAATLIADIPIVGITQNLNGTVAYTVPAGSTAGLVANTIYPSRVRDVNQGRSPLNGQCNLLLGNATTLVTKEVIAFALAQDGGSIKVYKPVGTFLPYGDLVLDLLTAKHKRYQGFLRHPGRAKDRIRG